MAKLTFESQWAADLFSARCEARWAREPELRANFAEYADFLAYEERQEQDRRAAAARSVRTMDNIAPSALRARGFHQ